ncbi:YhbY family RNA-binding protein [Methyloversatilis discipulorum]|uniref:YhbY family RNA-binding protein n=1 Tax=Methyloversatilis discipulorum TaxID=1119528 RepID=UPI001A5E4C00|nr:YhbY family RNA-binding protein [Methyloversatilis discipulorum]MBL8468278.1 YhbY family RNA-binding protein [Methyloversatilis discipulorum]
MLTLTPDERRALRAQAHPLKPVVMIAQNGLTAAVLKEIELALKSHELIKVRVFDADREQRDAWLAETCETLGAAPVQRIGNILVLYRPNPELHVPAEPVKPVRKSAAKTPAAKPVPTRSAPAKPVANRRGVARNSTKPRARPTR